MFGRVEGVVVRMRDEAGDDRLHVVVTLETGRRVEVVRDEVLAPLVDLGEVDALVWHADQWTQETIGVDLAERGWEVIGGGDLPEVDDDPSALARSATYAVRRLSGPDDGLGGT